MRLFEDTFADEAEIVVSQHPTTEPLKITVLRNITVEEIEPYLEKQAMHISRQVSVTFGNFDNIVQEANGALPHLFPKNCEMVLVFTHLIHFSPALANRFATMSENEVAQEIDSLTALFRAIINGIRKQTKATILWASFEPPAYPSLGIADIQSQNGQASTIAKLNDRLRESLHAFPSAYLIDMGAIALKLGTDAFYDLRYWHISKAPYSRRALAHTANEVFKFARAKLGLARKCLVLDCDNTLWGGVVGEDGVHGISIGSEFPGSTYLEFQQQVLDLRARGVIIALLSKNNEKDVWEVFDKHPDMVLKREHISAWRINWQDKATNIRELARELNIGLNSLVFVDDSDFELNLVASEVPEVLVVKAQTRKASENRWKLASLGMFDQPELTKEDRERSVMYAQERRRRTEKETVTDIAGYLKSLQIKLDVFHADLLSIPRIAQQTQKTNQFNLTTQRYSEADISQFFESERHVVLACRAADKHGELGIIGTIILELSDGRARLDTMLVSCRALGRGIEQRFLSEAIALVRRYGARELHGEYRPTAKNKQVDTFLDANGFELIKTESDGSKFYLLDLEGWSGGIEQNHFASVMAPLQHC